VPPIESLVLSADGLGPLLLGSDPASYDPATSIVHEVEVFCNGQADPPVSLLVPNYAVDNPPFGVARNEGRVTAIGLRSPLIATDRGARIGTTKDALLQLYPELELVVDAESSGLGVERYGLRGESTITYFDVDVVGGTLIGAGKVYTIILGQYSGEGWPGGGPSFHPVGESCL
jgi:hypothetical protein